MAAVVKLKDVWAMLDDCLPDHSKKASREYWTISLNGKLPYRGFPSGKHGKRENPDIESGHVRSLVRYFGINSDCSDKHVNLG